MPLKRHLFFSSYSAYCLQLWRLSYLENYNYKNYFQKINFKDIHDLQFKHFLKSLQEHSGVLER